MSLKVYLVSIGPGHRRDHLTLQAVAALDRAECILYPGVWLGGEIAELYRDKLMMGQGDRLDLLPELEARRDSDTPVAVLFNGDGCLFSGDGDQTISMGDLAVWCRHQGMEVEVIPGISSFQVACAELQCDFGRHGEMPAALVTSPLDGSARARRVVRGCLEQGVPVAALCSAPRADQIVELLEEAGLPEDYPVVIAAALGRPDAKLIRTTRAGLPRDGQGLSEPALFLLGVTPEAPGSGGRVGDSSWLLDGAHQLVGGSPDLMGLWQLELMVDLGLRPGDTLLDLGCGTLRGGLRFIEYLDRDNYTGVDPNEYLLVEARRLIVISNLVTRRPMIQNSEAFSFGRSRYDWVLTQSVLNHLDLAGVRDVIEKVAISLRPGGRWVTTYLLDSDVADVEPGEAHPERPDERLTSRMNPAWFAEVTRDAGLRWEHLPDVAHPRGLQVGVLRRR